MLCKTRLVVGGGGAVQAGQGIIWGVRLPPVGQKVCSLWEEKVTVGLVAMQGGGGEEGEQGLDKKGTGDLGIQEHASHAVGQPRFRGILFGSANPSTRPAGV